MDSDARAVVERYAHAWSNDDLDGILGCYADTFTLHYFGDNPFTGDHIGKDNAINTLLDAGARAPRKLLDVEQIMSGPGSAALVVRESIEVDSEPVEIRRMLRFAIEGDQFTDCWLYEEDQQVVDLAWSD